MGTLIPPTYYDPGDDVQVHLPRLSDVARQALEVVSGEGVVVAWRRMPTDDGPRDEIIVYGVARVYDNDDGERVGEPHPRMRPEIFFDLLHANLIEFRCLAHGRRTHYAISKRGRELLASIYREKRKA